MSCRLCVGDSDVSCDKISGLYGVLYIDMYIEVYTELHVGTIYLHTASIYLIFMDPCIVV